MGIDGEDKIPGLKQLVGVIHEGGATPKRMDKEDMDAVRDLFVAAARSAVSAGFDALELQLGHGYLLAQFLSPLVNDRNDEYGGDFAGCSRFPFEVVDAVRAAVDLPMIIRLSGAEMVPGGIEIEESVALAKELKTRGIAAVHVSAGTVCSTPPWYFQHMFVPRGNRITIVKRTTDFGEDMEMIAKKLSLKIMTENGTRFSDKTHIQRIEERTVFALRDDETVLFEDVDLIVVATGIGKRNAGISGRLDH